MIRRPPRSTLFPYTRSSDLAEPDLQRHHAGHLTRIRHVDLARRIEQRRVSAGARRRRDVRSEEHTSELQSPCNLVCRLLLEKKTTTSSVRTTRHQTLHDSSS